MFATIGWAIVKAVAMMAVSYLVNMALAPKQNNKGPEATTADEWDFPQADEGVPQCVFFGDCWTADWQVLSYGNYRTTEIKK
ncbi:hypothetical protein QJU96_10035 [Pasteurella skyensis]|uniref:Tail assembly protein n=1 Tax=Phocoenobacter skyensis TaxID=97481 RepID=A0AAJ6P338_9PAST|nr:hypothetical protein [Pasteurella skyensis]MDP8171621.1 hypothetical protein [Pasteurella skyensis]MDP8175457.1 hypothetical protein [Pasteurella skyensis]